MNNILFSHKGYVCEIAFISNHFRAIVCPSNTEQGETFMDFAESRVSAVMANEDIGELKTEFVNLVNRFIKYYGTDFPIYPKPDVKNNKIYKFPLYTPIPIGNKPRQRQIRRLQTA